MTKKFLHHTPHIAADLQYLLENDKKFAKLDLDINNFTWTLKKATFQSFIATIIGQQISTKAAASIYKKLLDYMDGKITPEAFMLLNDEELRSCGFSFSKIKYGRGLATAILEKQFFPTRLRHMEDNEVIADIVKLAGFGVWSAQMFLMFGLARKDIWPVGDLGIQLGAKSYLRLEEKPKLPEMEKLGKKWVGRRTSASLILWHVANNKIKL